MTSKETMEFYDLVGPDVARHVAEGGRILGPVVEVSLGYRDGITGFVVKGPAKEWQGAGEKINQILDVELGRLPPRTKTGLADIIRFISYFVPDEPLALPAAGIPDVAKAAARTMDRVLEEVCKE